MEKIDPSCTFLIYLNRVFVPLPQMAKCPLESPLMTSPDCKKFTQVTYLGLSLISNIPFLLNKFPFICIDQKAMWVLPQVTMQLLSIGWNSADTTVSTEH